MRRLCNGRALWLVGLLFCGLFTSCSHSPSYSDTKANKGANPADSNAARSEAGPSIEQVNPPAPSPSPPPAFPDSSSTLIPGSSPRLEGPASPSPTGTPAYLDPKTGRIKDLPLYPHAKVMGLQYGPIGGVSQVTLQAMIREPFEKVTAFYDKAVKDNGWTIDDNSRGVNSYTWQLSRGATDRAAIRIDKNEIGRVSISLARTN